MNENIHTFNKVDLFSKLSNSTLASAGNLRGVLRPPKVVTPNFQLVRTCRLYLEQNNVFGWDANVYSSVMTLGFCLVHYS